MIKDPKSAHYGDRAYGKYQVMENNIGPWTEELLGEGNSLTADEFLNSPSVQEMVFHQQVGKMLAGGATPAQVARKWFGSGSYDRGTGIRFNEYLNRFQQAFRG